MLQTRGRDSDNDIAQRIKSVFSGSLTGFSVLFVSILLFASAGAASTFQGDAVYTGDIEPTDTGLSTDGVQQVRVYQEAAPGSETDRSGVVHFTSGGDPTFDYALSWTDLREENVIEINSNDDDLGLSSDISYEYYTASDNTQASPDEAWLAVRRGGEVYTVFKNDDAPNTESDWSSRSLKLGGWQKVTFNTEGSLSAETSTFTFEQGDEIIGVGVGRGSPLSSSSSTVDVYFDDLQVGDQSLDFTAPENPYTVDDEQIGSANFASIQNAVDAAPEGATVKVIPGTYDESITIDTSGVTLEGPNADTTVEEERSDEATIDGRITVAAEGVTVDGVRVTGNQYGLVPLEDDFSLENSLVEAETTGVWLDEWDQATDSGDLVDSAPEDITLTQNIFSGHSAAVGGIEGDTNVDFNSNSFEANTEAIGVGGGEVNVEDQSGLVRADVGSYTAYYSTIQKAVDNAVSESTVEVYDGTYVSTDESEPAILIDRDIRLVGIGEPTISYEPSEKTGEPAVKVTGEGATVEGLDVDRVGHSDRSQSDGPLDSTTQGVRISASDVVVRDNDVDGTSLPGKPAKGIMVLDAESIGQSSDVSNVRVVENEVSGFYVGLSVTNGYQGSISDVNLSYNTVEDNRGHGANVATRDSDSTPSVDFEYNTFSDNKDKTLRIYGDGAESVPVEAEASQVDFNHNSVPQGSVLDNNGVGTLNAEHNYFGSESGPSEGQIQGEVDYRPWRMTPINQEGYDDVITFDDSQSWSAFSVAGEVEEAATASDVEVLSYNPSAEGNSDGWTYPGLEGMSPVDAAFVKGTKAVGVDYEDSESATRSLGEGWNFVGAFDNGEAQSLRNVFGTVESSMVSLQVPQHNSDKADERTTDLGGLTGSILSTSNLGSNQVFDSEASVMDGYWLKASGPANFGTQPSPSESPPEEG